MKIAHDADCLEVNRVLVLELVLLVAWDEGEVMDVAVKVGEANLNRVDAAQEWQGTLVIRF
ncbi:MAG: hypothetical protein WBD63_07810, partial [Phycisphaerae bacterium]